MDSLTQIVLGAACGEAVAGRKIGNRAILWGAIGGTIPDLDVLANLFVDEISATSFHRGFMHSFLFAALAPWLFAWLAQRFYDNGIYRRKGYKIAAMSVWLAVYVAAAAGVNFIPVAAGEGLRWPILAPTLALGVLLGYRLWRDYFRRDLREVRASYQTWVALFFWSIFTHPILDCFTNYGTQIWQPFSDQRIAWNTVSIVDPIYTVPFGLFLIVAASLRRGSQARHWWNWAGIVWGCFYLGLTVVNKQRVNRYFEQSLKTAGIESTRYMTNPSILTNTVWYGVAEADDAFYFGLIGLKDCRPGFDTLSRLPKNRELLADIPPDNRSLRFLRWFSDGYFNAFRRTPDTLLVHDLRFGLFGETIRDGNYVFSFLLYKNSEGSWEASGRAARGTSMSQRRDTFERYWRRMRGIPCD